MLEGEKVLITGATGKIAFPIARALAARNEVWGVARLRKPGDREMLADAGIHAVALDVSTGDFSSLPDDFSYVFHAAVDPGNGDWQRCVRTNAHSSGELLHHCRKAKGFVYCSSGSIYGYRGQRPLSEADGPGVPLRANYSFSKVAGEAVCTWVAEHFAIPLTIIRICSTYGPLGGAPADRLDAMLQGQSDPAPSRQAQLLQPDLRGRLRGARHPRDGGRPDTADRGQLGRERDRQRRGLLRVHG